MKKNYWVLIFCHSLLLTSCKQLQFESNSIQIETKNIINFSSKDIPTKEWRYSDIYSEIHYITLSNEPKAMFSSLNKLILGKNNDLIILDQNQNKVLRYDSNGQFLNEIGQRGFAENEYITPKLICYDTYNELVMINDHTKHCILCYKSDGKYVKKIPLGEYIDAMAVINKSRICYYINNFYNCIANNPSMDLSIIDHNGEILFQGFPHNKVINFPTSNTRVFKQHNDRVYFCPPYSYAVYQVFPDSIKPMYLLNYSTENIIYKDSVIAEMPIYPREVNKNSAHWHSIDFYKNGLFCILFNKGMVSAYKIETKDSILITSYDAYNPMINDLGGIVTKQIESWFLNGKAYNLIYPEKCQEIIDSKINISDQNYRLLEHMANNNNYTLQVCSLKQ